MRSHRNTRLHGPLPPALPGAHLAVSARPLSPESVARRLRRGSRPPPSANFAMSAAILAAVDGDVRKLDPEVRGVVLSELQMVGEADAPEPKEKGAVAAPPAPPKIVSPQTLPPHLFNAYRDVIMAQMPAPPSPLPFSPDLLGAREALEERLGVKLRARHADPTAMARALQVRLRKQLGGPAEAAAEGALAERGARAANISAEVREQLEAMRQHHRARVLQLKQRLAAAQGEGQAAAQGAVSSEARREAIRKAREAHREHVRELRAEARRQHEARAREIEERRLAREAALHDAPSWALPAAATAATAAPRSRFAVTPPATAASLSAAALQRMQVRRAPHMWMESAGEPGQAMGAGEAEAREWMGPVASAADGVKGLKSLVEALHNEDPRALYADMIRQRIRQAGSAGAAAAAAAPQAPRRLAPRMNAASVPWVPAMRRGELGYERDPSRLRPSPSAGLRLRPSRPAPPSRRDPRTELFASMASRLPQSPLPLPPRARPIFRSSAASPSFVVRPRRSCRCGAGSRWKQSA
jgi:hypothetical protein